MNRHLPDLHAWRWRGVLKLPTQHAIRLMALLLLIPGLLLVTCGVMTLDLGQAAVGVLAMIAAFCLTYPSRRA